MKIATSPLGSDLAPRTERCAISSHLESLMALLTLARMSDGVAFCRLLLLVGEICFMVILQSSDSADVVDGGGDWKMGAVVLQLAMCAQVRKFAFFACVDVVDAEEMLSTLVVSWPTRAAVVRVDSSIRFNLMMISACDDADCCFRRKL